MDSNKIPSFRINKTGIKKEMVSDINGEWIKKIDYESLLWKYNSCKESWNLNNAMLNLSRIIEELKLDANTTLTLQMLASSMVVCMQSIVEKAGKDKQKEEELNKLTREQ